MKLVEGRGGEGRGGEGKGEGLGLPFKEGRINCSIAENWQYMSSAMYIYIAYMECRCHPYIDSLMYTPVFTEESEWIVITRRAWEAPY